MGTGTGTVAEFRGKVIAGPSSETGNVNASGAAALSNANARREGMSPMMGDTGLWSAQSTRNGVVNGAAAATTGTNGTGGRST